MRAYVLEAVLAFATLAIGIAAQQQADFDFTFHHVMTPASNSFLTLSGTGTKVNGTSFFSSDFVPDGTSMVCNLPPLANGDSGCVNDFVEFQFGGRGFCLQGKLGATIKAYINPDDSSYSNKFDTYPTDGETYCLGQLWEPAYTAYRIENLERLDSVNFTLVSNLPPGYTADDLTTVTVPFVKNGQPNDDPALSFSRDNAIAATINGVESLHFDRTVVKITAPERTAGFILNGAVGPDLNQIYVSSPQALPFIPNIILNSTYTIEDNPLILLSLNSSVQYDILLNAVQYSESRGMNFTSVTFFQFLKNGSSSDNTTSTGSTTSIATTGDSTATGGTVGTQDHGASSKKTNVGAIAGGVVGGAVALALLALLLWFCLLKGRNKRAKAQPPLEGEIDAVVNPYVSQRHEYEPVLTNMGNYVPQQNITAAHSAKATEATYSQQYPVAGSSATTPYMSPRDSFFGSQAGPSMSSALSDFEVSSSATSPPVHEEDAGAVTSQLDRLPPMYNPQWQSTSSTPSSSAETGTRKN